MSMYARIQDGLIFEFFETDGDITQMFHPSLTWIDVSEIDPFPGVGWSYDGANFHPPIVVPPDRKPIILNELLEIDREGAGSLRALIISSESIGAGTPERALLEALEARALVLREELASLP